MLRVHPSAQSLLWFLRRFFYCTETDVTQWEKPELGSGRDAEAKKRADLDSTRAQVLGLHGPVSAELLEEIDALYAEVRPRAFCPEHSCHMTS